MHTHDVSITYYHYHQSGPTKTLPSRARDFDDFIKIVTNGGYTVDYRTHDTVIMTNAWAKNTIVATLHQRDQQ